jgi:glycosyltransferase involved in cell wall biosynthesis
MKLVVLIPCYNESATLEDVVRAVPRVLQGFDCVDVFVVDDGSHDATSEVARRVGVDHIVRFRVNRGLARAWAAGVDAALRAGADVIVNTDGDGQYEGSDIAALVGPIVSGEADLVVGDRAPGSSPYFSLPVRLLQRLGSWVVRRASNTTVPDAASGFRAMTREAALGMMVTSEFSYTIETLIQAGYSRLAVTSVPVRTHPPTRPSRLHRSVIHYILASAATLLRVYALYRPFEVFLSIAASLSLAATALSVRFLFFHLTEAKTGHTQSLLLAVILFVSAGLSALAGLITDIIGGLRRLVTESLMRQRRAEYADYKILRADRHSQIIEIARENTRIANG